MKPGNSKVKQLKRKLKKKPDLYEANIQMGIHYLQNNNIATAVIYLNKAYAVKKDDASLIFVLANAYEALSNISKSRELYQKAIAIDSDNPEYLHKYGLFLQKIQEIDEAIKTFKNVTRFQPDNFELLNDIGVLYHHQQKYEEAKNYLEKAIALKSDYILAHINLAHVLMASGDFYEALQIADQLNQKYYQNPDVMELKRQVDNAINNISEDVLNNETELSFSDQLFQITPLTIIKDFGEKRNLEKIGLSIVIPIRNERENIPILYDELIGVLNNLKEPYEIIFIDDGSSDGSKEVLESLAEINKDIRVIQFRRNYGQTAAINAGFKYSKGSVVITLDGDLQNDPSDIPRLLKKMSEGYDLVSGWRKNRQDKMFTRKIPSLLANRIINKLIEGTNVQLHDFGCTLKAYKKGIIKNINLYGEMHRFIPVFAAWLGVRIAEIPVNHRPRRFGNPKYNLSRISRVIFDLIVVRFFSDYMTRPIQFFGKIAKKLATGGLIIIIFLGSMNAILDLSISINTLIILMSILLFASLQILFIGLLGEILIRSYFEGQKKDYYVVEKIVKGESGA
jgi:glycosyltransferase involved in cell wall biosynthesis/Tfp pilus assembly protein PilF